MKEKALIISVSSNHFIAAISKLENDGIIQPVFWSGSVYLKDKVQKLFRNTTYVNVHDLTCADLSILEKNGIPLIYSTLFNDFYQSFSFEKLLVTENLLHRSDPGGNFTHSEIRDTVNNYFVIAASLLNYYKPTFILFEVAPHVMYDLAIYFLAKKANIKVLMLHATNLEKISFVSDTIYTRNDNFFEIDNSFFLNNNIVEETFKKYYDEPLKKLFYMPDKVKHISYIYLFYSFLIQIFLLVKNSLNFFRNGQLNTKGGAFDIVRNRYRKLKGKMLYEKTSNPDIFHLFKNLILQNYYKKISLHWEQIKDVNYIYVPLAYQHEATTMPCAGFMYDQYSWIIALLDNLPKNVKLFIKENPKQFTANQGIMNRDKRFYKEILLKGGIFVKLETDSKLLIKYAKAVAITTGSAGIESLLHFKKPVITFSGSWYDCLPEVYVISNDDNLKIVINKILSLDYYFDGLDLKFKYFNLMRKAIYLYPEYSTIKNNCWDEAAMAENLYILIKKYLNNTLIISP